MVSDMLNSVLEKEKETSLNESEAKKQAEKIVAEAYEKAAQILDGSKIEIAEKENEMISRAKKNSDEAVQNAAMDAEKQSEILKSGCEAKLTESIDEVKRIILD